MRSTISLKVALLSILAVTGACRAPQVQPLEAEPAEAPAYVGDETCLACHEAMHPGFTAKYEHTVHSRVLNVALPGSGSAAHGCESCHGPGGNHVSAGGGKGVGGFVPFGVDTADGISRINATCMTCHKGGQRSYWQGSPHESSEVACTNCHTLMQTVSQERMLSARTEVETCGRCHQVQHSRTFRNAHMPLRTGEFQSGTASDGKMRCSSCHQPHGSVTRSLIRQVSVNDQCLSCHAEKRGPFLWEHPPVVEDCLNCHDPHGSTRRAMLKMNVIRLCQSCHVSTGHATTARLPTDRFAVGTSCLQCHTQVHGSNHPSGFALTR